LVFQAWVHAVMSSASALTVACDERRSFLVVSLVRLWVGRERWLLGAGGAGS
jgi:hypothetical protein